MIIAYLAMAIIVVSSNYLVLYPINDWLTWAAFTYPISYLVTELSNRFYGPKKARLIVYTGFILAVILSFWLSTPKIACASGLAFLISQLLDIFIFSKLRQSAWWYAPLLASVFASGVDTAIFWTIGFWGEAVPALSWALGDMTIKIIIDATLLIPFRLIIQRVSTSQVKGAA